MHRFGEGWEQSTCGLCIGTGTTAHADAMAELDAIETADAAVGTRLNDTVIGGRHDPAALAAKSPEQSGSDDEAGTAREAPKAMVDKAGVSSSAPGINKAQNMIRHLRTSLENWKLTESITVTKPALRDIIDLMSEQDAALSAAEQALVGFMVRPGGDISTAINLMWIRCRLAEDENKKLRSSHPALAKPVGWLYRDEDGKASVVTDPDTARIWRETMKRTLEPVFLLDFPQGAFVYGDHVRKKKGSRWQGHVVGFYTTALTPVGYAIESETETGSVQIYPENAIEFVSLEPQI